MTPFVEISLGGTPLSGFQKRTLSGQIVEYDGEHADELHIAVSNYDGRLRKPKTDETVMVRLGWKETGAVKVGQFVITEIVKNGPRAEFQITGHSADLKKTLKEQKTRSWTKGKKLKDVLEDVAKDNQLELAVDEELGSIEIEKIIAQTGESDMHLVTRLARQFNALSKFQNKKLVFVKKGAGKTASGQDAGSETITPNDCEGFSFSQGARNERGKGKAVHYDRSKAKRSTEESQGGVQSDGVPDYVAPQIYGTQVEAKWIALSRKKKFDRETKRFNCTRAPGQVGLAPGGVATTKGFGDDDDGEWTVKRRLFGFSADGLVVRMDCEPKEEQQQAG
ncbi:MAG TPA: contractile injection system protein, VgrG/Pvc8 family [Methylocystis sp.]|jgi:hypothetical protein